MQSESVQLGLPSDAVTGYAYRNVINDVPALTGRASAQEDLVNVAWAYCAYFDSVSRRMSKWRKNLLTMSDYGNSTTASGTPITSRPGPALPQLGRGCIIEFMRRRLKPRIDRRQRKRSLAAVGSSLSDQGPRAMDDDCRAMALASYEDGGLERCLGGLQRLPALG